MILKIQPRHRISGVFSVTESTANLDVGASSDPAARRKELLALGGSLLPKPSTPPAPLEFYEHLGHRFGILRFDAIGGFKYAAAEYLFATIKESTVVYCAPRTGHAAVSIAALAKKHGKRAVFFAPASNEASSSQRAVLAFGNSELKFVRIAAMPVLNSYARKYAAKVGARFLPFGLSGVKEITAGIVCIADRLLKVYSSSLGSHSFFCAVSTGTMIRGLQLGWPLARAHGVAVARNIHDGEVGSAVVHSYHLPFSRAVCDAAGFPASVPSTATYDLKAFRMLTEALGRGRPPIFINVGSDAHIERLASLAPAVDSKRAWGDFTDLEDA